MPSAPTTTSALTRVPFSKMTQASRVCLLEADASVARMDDVQGHAVQEHLQQVGAVHAVHLGSLCPARRPHRRDQSAVRMTELRIEPACAEAGHLVAKPQPAQHAHAVRVERDPRANLLELRRLLVHTDLDALLQQRVRGGDSANTAPDDGYSHALRASRCRAR